MRVVYFARISSPANSLRSSHQGSQVRLGASSWIGTSAVASRP